jgi:hypothetical protein
MATADAVAEEKTQNKMNTTSHPSHCVTKRKKEKIKIARRRRRRRRQRTGGCHFILLP